MGDVRFPTFLSIITLFIVMMLVIGECSNSPDERAVPTATPMTQYEGERVEVVVGENADGTPEIIYHCIDPNKGSSGDTLIDCEKIYPQTPDATRIVPEEGR